MTSLIEELNSTHGGPAGQGSAVAAEEGNLAVAFEESALHVVEVSGDGCREGGMSTSGADAPKPEKYLNAEPASVAPDPDPAPGFTVRSGIAFDLDATGPLPDVREDAETLEAARRLREGRLGYRAFKRAFDVAFSACVLVCLSWLFAIIALAVKLDDPSGPVLFRQRRVGRLGRDGEPVEFDMYKFRSMVPDAESRLAELKAMNEKTGPVFKMRDDPRVTRVGRILRKTSMAPVIIGTPGDGEPTKSLSHPVNSSLDLHKCERRPEPFLVAQTHYTSSRFLSFAVFGGLNAARGRSFCACGATS